MAVVAGGVRLSLSSRPSRPYKNKKICSTFYTHKIEYCSEVQHFTLPITSYLEKHAQIIKSRKNPHSTSSFSSTPAKKISYFPISPTKLNQNQTHIMYPTPLHATLNSPKGFGPSPKKTRKTEKPKKDYKNDDDDDDEEEEEEEEDAIIPEIVTNRMMSRMGFSVGIPLFIGLLFFPFFYYLKVVLKIDVPYWVPFIVSFIFFGTALLGVSYGIVSSSWDPMREGSLLGWNEAKKNWPVFWQSLRGRSGNK